MIQITPHGSLAVIGAGVATLAVAVGVGRFAFTPLMPLMIRDGTLTQVIGAEWAAANYIGYLIGALSAPWFSRHLRGGIAISLAGISVATLAASSTPSDWWLLAVSLRLAAGVFSAWALVCVSSYCLNELVRLRVPHLGAWIYTGVGLGISISGLLAWLGGTQPASWLWAELAVISLLIAIAVIWSLQGEPVRRQSASPNASGVIQSNSIWNRAGLVVCYGAFGFGYIVPATFLPVMAQHLHSDPLIFGLTWPLFGAAAMLSVAAAARWLSAWPRARVWAAAQAVMAIGTALPIASQSLVALAASAVLVGGTFMVATMAGLQLARDEMPHNPTPLQAAMTAAFAAGQIAGPVLVRALSHLDAFIWTNACATLVLIATALWLLTMSRQPHQS